MANCKDCIHYNVCGMCGDEDDIKAMTFCRYFKDKSSFVELPCKVGDSVFVVNGFKEIEELEVAYYVIEKNVIGVGIVDDGEYEVETVFLTREEAEQALKESDNNAIRKN